MISLSTMVTRFSGCDISYMECSSQLCKKLYQLKCVGTSTEAFGVPKDEHISNWSCPKCVYAKQKWNYIDTPVTGIVTNETFTPNFFINSETRKKSDDISKGNEMLLRELREFRAEINSRFDEQFEAYKTLQYHLMTVETELQQLKNRRAIVEEQTEWSAAATNDSKKKGQETITSVGKCMENTTFANITKRNLKELSVKKCGAQRDKIGTSEMVVLDTNVILKKQENKLEKDNEWKEVRIRKNRVPNKKST